MWRSVTMYRFWHAARRPSMESRSRDLGYPPASRYRLACRERARRCCGAGRMFRLGIRIGESVEEQLLRRAPPDRHPGIAFAPADRLGGVVTVFRLRHMARRSAGGEPVLRREPTLPPIDAGY
ncbi:hypothetical protein [Ancylobacter oerskovii]|uniref:Uncharacterized protein n=1 Tax=Ancylobacter oerskovii TaxID=459519 RepID=A0ABW4YX08_9HYPH